MPVLTGIDMDTVQGWPALADVFESLPLRSHEDHDLPSRAHPTSYLRFQELHSSSKQCVGCRADVMYIADAVGPLLATLAAVSSKRTEILLAHGRNRQAEARFLQACAGSFLVERVPGQELDAVYQCSDVDVLRLRRV